MDRASRRIVSNHNQVLLGQTEVAVTPPPRVVSNHNQVLLTDREPGS